MHCDITLPYDTTQKVVGRPSPPRNPHKLTQSAGAGQCSSF